jgi:hypothetical protein
MKDVQSLPVQWIMMSGRAALAISHLNIVKQMTSIAAAYAGLASRFNRRAGTASFPTEHVHIDSMTWRIGHKHCK